MGWAVEWERRMRRTEEARMEESWRMEYVGGGKERGMYRNGWKALEGSEEWERSGEDELEGWAYDMAGEPGKEAPHAEGMIGDAKAGEYGNWQGGGRNWGVYSTPWPWGRMRKELEQALADRGTKWSEEEIRRNLRESMRKAWKRTQRTEYKYKRGRGGPGGGGLIRHRG